MTIVIGVLLALMSIGFVTTSKYDEWKLGRQAGETIRAVWSAQRTYLSDHPTTLVENITGENIRLYLTGQPAALPTVTSLTGAALQISVSVTPPYAVDGGGARYDPSGSFTDQLWDVGQ